MSEAPTLRLGAVAEVSAGNGAPQGLENFGETGYPFVRAGSLERLLAGGGEHSLERIPDSTGSRLRLRVFPAGTVLFAKSGMSALKGLVYQLDSPAYVVSHLAAVIPSSELDGRYLLHWLRYNPPSRLINDSAYPSIRLADIAHVQIPLPAKEQQRRMATMLDRVDALQNNQRIRVRLLDNFLNSTFFEMFGDPVKNEKGWRQSTLGELLPERALIVDGPFGSSLKPDSYVSSGVRVIRNFNIEDDSFDGSAFKFITAEKFEQVRRSEVVAGDVLISTKGTLGNVCLMPQLSGQSVLSASGTVRVRLPDELALRRQFMVSQMITRSYKQYLKGFEAGTNQKYMNLSGIRRLAVILPPIELQDKFSRVRETVAVAKERHAAALRASNALSESLTRESFGGRPSRGWSGSS